jgi:transposase
MAEEPGSSVKREIKRRRRFTEEFRRQVVEETLAGESSIAAVALRHGLNNNLVFTWRRKYLRALAREPGEGAKMLPVTIMEPSVPAVSVAKHPQAARAVARGAIEIEWNGVRVVVNGAVDTRALQMVLTALGPG